MFVKRLFKKDYDHKERAVKIIMYRVLICVIYLIACGYNTQMCCPHSSDQNCEIINELREQVNVL